MVGSICGITIGDGSCFASNKQTNNNKWNQQITIVTNKNQLLLVGSNYGITIGNCNSFAFNKHTNNNMLLVCLLVATLLQSLISICYSTIGTNEQQQLIVIGYNYLEIAAVLHPTRIPITINHLLDAMLLQSPIVIP